MMSLKTERVINIFLEAGFEREEFTVITPNENDIESGDEKIEIKIKGFNIEAKYAEPKFPALIKNDIIVTKVISEHYVPGYIFELGAAGKGEQRLFDADRKVYIKA